MTTNLENFTTDYKVQGVTGVVDLAELHINTVRACLMYGIRRKLQDTINSAAKQARDNDESYDAKGEVAALVAHFKAGTLPTRGEGMSSLETETFRLARAAFKADKGKDVNKALGEKIPAEIRIVLTAFMGDAIDDYREQARVEIDRKAAEARARADRMAELLTRKAAVEFDLKEFGL